MGNEKRTLEECLTYINDCLIIHGSNIITIYDIREIHKISITLDALKSKNITTDTYKREKDKYNRFITKAFEEYGIEIEEKFPFSNPTDLYIKIDEILINSGLNSEQRKEFYKETELRKRVPKQRKVRKSLLSCIEISEVEDDDWLSNNDEWDNLSYVEQGKITGITPSEREEIYQNSILADTYCKERKKKKNYFKRLTYNPSK